MAEGLRIFISAVTGEFGKARDAIASDLRARGHEVTVQSEFHQSPNSETLLGALADYIRDCHAAVCLVGKYSGAFPPARALEHLPIELVRDAKQRSYTQWECFFARYFRRRPYVYIANDDYQPDQTPAASDRLDLQSAYLDSVKADGVHYTKFSDANELRIAVLRDEPKIAAQPATSEGNPAKTKPIVLPYPSIGDLFKGRDEFMQRLHDSLTKARGARTAIFSQALYGLGGIGKSRVAVEYAWAHADDYNALLFVVAETPETLRRNLAALATTLVPQLDTTDDEARLTAVLDWLKANPGGSVVLDDVDNKKALAEVERLSSGDEVRLAAVLDWLKANPGWFLVLDNVDSKEALAEVERLLSGLIGGHVVVTSRLADFSAHFKPLELDVLTIEDAVAFLLARTKDRRRTASDDEATAREVAEGLGGLALALEQAAAFVGKQRLTFAKYLEQWRSSKDDDDEVLKWFDPTVTDYPRSVAVTWQTSVAKLTDGGRRLLERLAWLAPEKVPEALIDVPIPRAKDKDLRQAFNDLVAYSLVTRDAEGPFFLVHRLVQDVTRRSLAKKARKQSLVEALRWIDAAFADTSVDVRNWEKLEPLAPHAGVVTTHADAAGIAKPTAKLMNELGMLFSEKALHAQAEPLLRRALAIDEKSFGPDHPEVSDDLNNLAQLLHETNRLAEAEPLMRRALVIDEKNSGPNHPDVARDFNNLAQLLHDTNRLAEAEPLMRRALAIDEENASSPHDSDVASDLNNLAQLLQDLNHLAEAESLMRRALAIDEKNYGQDHPAVARDLNNLGGLLYETARRGESEPLLRRALAIDEKHYGENHPEVAQDLSSLGRLLRVTERYDEAEPLMRRALTIDEKSFGQHHPIVASRLNNLARLLQSTKRPEEAEPLMRRAVAIRVEFTRRTGHRDPRLDAVFANYARLLSVLGKNDAEIEVVRADLLRPLADKPPS